MISHLLHVPFNNNRPAFHSLQTQKVVIPYIYEQLYTSVQLQLRQGCLTRLPSNGELNQESKCPNGIYIVIVQQCISLYSSHCQSFNNLPFNQIRQKWQHLVHRFQH